MQSECPVHSYELDFSSLSKRGTATFGTERRALSARDGAADESALHSARSVLSDGHTPRSRQLLGPEFDLGMRKHTFRASIDTSGRKPLRQAPCPVHSYTGTPSTLGRQSAPFGRAARPAALPPLPSGSSTTMLGPEFDKTLKPGTFSASFSSTPRKLGTEVVGAPVHAYETASPLGKRAHKATFGTESRFGSESVSVPVHAHHTPSPMGKKAFKATFGTASRFGTGSCRSDVTPRRLPSRARPLPAALVDRAEQQPQEQQLTTVEPQPPLKKLDELLVPTFGDAKDLEPTMPLSARLLGATQSPWRHALPLPEIQPAEVAGAA